MSSSYTDAFKQGKHPRPLPTHVKEQLVTAGLEHGLTASQVCKLFKLYCLGHDALDEMVAVVLEKTLKN